jgi:DNA-binding MarR family transcriptional regulator
MQDRQVPVNMVGDRLPARPRLSFLLRQLQQHYADDIDAALRDAGFGDVNPGQAKVFPFVPPEGIQVGELADLAGVRKQTMAEAVDQLVRAGYLERRPNPRDARSRLIFLTQRGESARPVAIAAGQRVEERWAELTSPEQIETVRQHLRHLLEKLGQRPPG